MLLNNIPITETHILFYGSGDLGLPKIMIQTLNQFGLGALGQLGYIM